MLKLLLNPQFLLYGLIALAIATPLTGAIAMRNAPPRTRIVVGCAGPFALILWFLHNAVLENVGFDRVASILIVCGMASIIGFAAGWWASAKE